MNSYSAAFPTFLSSSEASLGLSLASNGGARDKRADRTTPIEILPSRHVGDRKSGLGGYRRRACAPSICRKILATSSSLPLATKLARRQRATVPCAGSAKAGAFASLRIIGPPVQRLAAPTIFSRFCATPGEPTCSMEQQEENAPNGLAGCADFREFRLKGVANELSARTKRNVIGRSV
jgi:hypothetical protein